MIKLNRTEVEGTRFPDGTGQVWKIDPEVLNPSYSDGNYPSRVDWLFEDEGELLDLAQLKALLDSEDKKAKLWIQYLPYARQDKPVGNEATFALYPFAKLLNSLEFDEVVILDPHSHIALDLINNSTAIFPEGRVDDEFHDNKIDTICYPDKGAKTKYSNIYTSLPSVYADKVREPLTGKILETTVTGDVAGKRVLIVDDICDGGATFIALAKVLKERGATYVGLFVTHGIFSKGIQILLDSGIDKVSYSHLQGEEK